MRLRQGRADRAIALYLAGESLDSRRPGLMRLRLPSLPRPGNVLDPSVAVLQVARPIRPRADLSSPRNDLGGSGSMAETRRWLKGDGNSLDSLAQDNR